MIEAYDNGKHYAMVCKWLKAKGIEAPDPTFFSDFGIVVDETAVGFLFKTNSKQCYMDQIAANPGASAERRDSALDSLFIALQQEAFRSGFRMVIALADLDAMKKRFLKHQFKAFRDFTLFYKQFSGG